MSASHITDTHSEAGHDLICSLLEQLSRFTVASAGLLALGLDRDNSYMKQMKEMQTWIAKSLSSRVTA